MFSSKIKLTRACYIYQYMYIHYTYHIISSTETLSIQHSLPSTRHIFIIRHQFCILFSPLHLRCHYSLSCNLIKNLRRTLVRFFPSSTLDYKNVPNRRQHCREFCSMANVNIQTRQQTTTRGPYVGKPRRINLSTTAKR